MKHTKKLLSLLLVLVMVLGMLPGPVLAVGEDDPAGMAGYATVEDLNAAFETVGETDDVDAALAALDEYLAVYDRLSDEDKAANAEAAAAAQAYRDSLVAAREAGDGEEDDQDLDSGMNVEPGIQTLADWWTGGGTTLPATATRNVQIWVRNPNWTSGSGKWLSQSSTTITINLNDNASYTMPPVSTFYSVPPGYTFSGYLVSCGGTGGAGPAGAQTALQPGQKWYYISGTAHIEIRLTHTHQWSGWKYNSTQHWKECTICGEKTSQANHSHSSSVHPADCYNGGYTSYSNCVCGYSKANDNYTSRLAPDYTGQNWYTWNGQQRMDCKRCGGGADGHYKTQTAQPINVTYTVNHYYRLNGTQEASNQTTGSATAGTVIYGANVTQTSYDGKTYNYNSSISTASITLNANGSNVLNLYYDRTESDKKTVNLTIVKQFNGISSEQFCELYPSFALVYNIYQGSLTGNPFITSALMPEFNAKSIDEDAKTITWEFSYEKPTNTVTYVRLAEIGYEVTGYTCATTVSPTGERFAKVSGTYQADIEIPAGLTGRTYTITNTYTPTTPVITEADYTVNWYDTDGNVLKAPETRKGTVGTTVSATSDDKSVGGYIYLEGRSTSSATLAASGTELKLYFAKKITVTWEKEDGTQIKQETIPKGADYSELYPTDQSTTGKWGTPVTDGDGNITIRWEEPEPIVKYVETTFTLNSSFCYGDANLADTVMPNYSLNYEITNPNVPDFKLTGKLTADKATRTTNGSDPAWEWTLKLNLPQSFENAAAVSSNQSTELYGRNQMKLTANYTAVDGYVYAFSGGNALTAARANPGNTVDTIAVAGTTAGQGLRVFNGYALPQKAQHTYYESVEKTTVNGTQNYEAKSGQNNAVVYSGSTGSNVWSTVKTEHPTYSGKTYICVSKPNEFIVRLNTVPFRYDYVRAVTVTWLDKDGGQIQKETIPNGGDYSKLYPSNPSDTGKWGDPQTDGNGNITIKWEEPVGPVNPDPTYAIEVKKALNTTGTVKNGDEVSYTVTVTNKSTASLYNLAIDDTADAGLSLKEIVSATYKNGESTTNITLPNVKTITENGKTVNTWEGVLDEFAVDGVVTLTYKATVTNEGTEKVTLANVAHAKGFKTAPTAKLNSAKRIVPVSIMLLSNDGYVEDSDSGSSSATVVIPPAKDYVEDWSDGSVNGEGGNGGTKVEVDPSDPTPVDPNAPVEITKTAKSATAKPGDIVTYIVTITNKTNSQQTVTFKDDLANGGLVLGNGTTLSIQHGRDDVVGDVSGSFTGVGTTFTLAARVGAKITFEYTARVPANAKSGEALKNTATAAVGGKDYTASATVTVVPVTDDGKGIKVEKTLKAINGDTTKTQARTGDMITWNVKVTNLSNVKKTVALNEMLRDARLDKYTVTLEAGASETVTATYTVKETDDAGTLKNVVVGVIKKADGTLDGDEEKGEDNSVRIVKDGTYTLKYNANGGTGAPADQTQVNNNTFAISEGRPTRNNYTFQGWALTAGGAVAYQPGGSITISGTEQTLYAIWRRNTPVIPDEPDEPDDPITYTLTINYVDAEGNVVASQHRESLESGASYSVPSPDVEGMTPDQAVVSGRLTGNTTVTVRYTADEEIEDPDTPTTESPEPSETPEPSEEPGDEEDLGDEDTPLAELPDTEPDESEDLADEDTPLANVPQTGDKLWLWIFLTLCSAAGLFCFFPRKKGKREV